MSMQLAVFVIRSVQEQRAMSKQHVADGETHCADTRKLTCYRESLLRLLKAKPSISECASLKPAHVAIRPHTFQLEIFGGSLLAFWVSCRPVEHHVRSLEGRSNVQSGNLRAACDTARACGPSNGRRSYTHSKPPLHLTWVRSHLRVESISLLVWVCRPGLWWTN